MRPNLKKKNYFHSTSVLVFCITFLNINVCSGTNSDQNTAVTIGLLNLQSGLGNNRKPPTSSGTVDPIESSAGSVGVPDGQACPNGEPHNAPQLNPLDLSTAAADPSQDSNSTKGLIQIAAVGFSQPVHSKTSITYFRGKPNMTLKSDGTVTNFIEMHNVLAQADTGTSFLVPSDQRFKILAVAKNEFGISSQEIVSGHRRICATTTVASCNNDHCIESSKTGSQISLTAKADHQNPQTSFYLDLATWTPGGESAFIGVKVLEGATSRGSYQMTYTIDITNWNYMCVSVDSMKIDNDHGDVTDYFNIFVDTL